MKKISISSWAIPQEMKELTVGAKKMGFDGISLGGFPPYGANQNLLDTDEKLAEYVGYFKDNELEVADYAIDVWAYNALTKTAEWRKAFSECLAFADKLGLTKIIRFDTCAPPKLPEGMTYEEVKAFYIKHFKELSQEAAKYGQQLVWEFEPGFIINEPEHVLDVVKRVDEPNFKLLFDTCHGYNCALGLNAIAPNAALDGGIMEFIKKANGYIGLVHVIDADGKLNHDNTSEHVPFGDPTGLIDFDEIIPALMSEGGYVGDWWAIDLCEWPNAWEVTETCKKFVDRFNRKFS